MTTKKITNKTTAKQPDALTWRSSVVIEALKLGYTVEEIPAVLEAVTRSCPVGEKVSVVGIFMREIMKDIRDKKVTVTPAGETAPNSWMRQSPKVMRSKIEDAQRDINEVSHVLVGLRWIADVMAERTSAADCVGIEDSYKGSSHDLAMLLDCLTTYGNTLVNLTLENALDDVHLGLREMEKPGIA